MDGTVKIWLLCLFAFSGCLSSDPTPPANSAVTAPISVAVAGLDTAGRNVGSAQRDRDSKLAASLESIGRQIGKLPPSPEQFVLEAEQTFSLRLLGGLIPTEADRADAARRESLFLSGDVEGARKTYAKANVDADALIARIKSLEAERDAAVKRASDAIAETTRKLEEQQRQHDAEVEKVRRAAAAKELFYQSLIFSGLGALCIIAAAGMLYLRSVVPMFGPQAAACVAGAGLFLIIIGILVRAITRLIEDHPYLFWGGITISVIAAIFAAGVVYSNRHHAKS